MRTVFLSAIYVILILLLIPVLFFCICFRTDTPLFAAGRWAVRLGQRILGLRVQIRGEERLGRKGVFVFMPNHQSLLDGPLIFMLIPHRLRIIVKKEIFRIPVVGQAMRFVDFVPVDRKGTEGGKKSIKKALQLMREKRCSFLIFPEGTRSRDGRLQEFRRGGFYLALESRADIVPISINGTFALLPKGGFSIKKGTIDVIFHPPVSLQGRTFDDLLALMKEVKEAILSGIVPVNACEA